MIVSAGADDHIGPKKHCVGRADVVIGPYAVDKLTEQEIGS